MIRAAARAAFPAALAASPLVLALVPEQHLPSAVAYLVHDGRAAIAFLAGLVFGAGLQLKVAIPAIAERVEQARPSVFGLILGCLAFAAALFVTPTSRWNGDGFGGDEPKYLRLAESLLQDLDVDVKSQSQDLWTFNRFAGSVRRLFRDAGGAFRGLFESSDAQADGHRWSRGNWTLQGRHGGEYYVQSPGLPLLLLPGLVLREMLDLAQPPTFIPVLTLALLWTLALVQTVLLASEISGSRLAGLFAGIAAAVSAPLLIGGLHFYPESAAVAFVPWLLRHCTSRQLAATGAFKATLLGLGCGFLPWLHPKFLLAAVALAALLASRLRGKRLQLGLLLGAAAVALFALLLFDHHVTGLLTPDALYRRYGSAVYRGPSAFLSPLVVNGLITALFGARDGLLVMAPVLIAGALAIGVSARHDRRSTLALVAVFASLWLAAAVHEGGAPGPPGRLMAPVACVLAALLALGLARLSKSLAYLVTVAALGALTLSITFAMLEEWRRTNNPYREMFGSSTRDFAKDLPDGPGRREAPYDLHKSRDRLRGAVLVALVGFWSWWFAHYPADAAFHRHAVLRRWVVGFWATLGIAAFALWALGP